MVASHVSIHANVSTVNNLRWYFKENPSSLTSFIHLDSFTFTGTVDTVSCMFHMPLERHHTWFQWAAPYQQVSEPWCRHQVWSAETSETRWAGCLQLVFLTGDKRAKRMTGMVHVWPLPSCTSSNQPASCVSCLFPCRTLAKPSFSLILSQPAVGIKHF